MSPWYRTIPFLVRYKRVWLSDRKSALRYTEIGIALQRYAENYGVTALLWELRYSVALRTSLLRYSMRTALHRNALTTALLGYSVRNGLLRYTETIYALHK